MKKVDKISETNMYVELAAIIRIANRAVKKAKEENKELGIPDTFWKNGKLYYALENGEITIVPPEIMKRKTA
ncbi:MAG: hypothetical protein AAF146_09045 [Bacteroidota bacterium]